MKRIWERFAVLGGSNVALKILALIIAIGLWAAGHRDTERAIGDQQHLIGLHAGAEFLHFLDQIGIDLQTTGGVEDDAVSRRVLRRHECGRANRRHVF